LEVCASQFAQRVELLLLFDALGDRLQSERLRELNDRVDKAASLRATSDVVDEALVDLQNVDRKLGECGKRRVASTEIVNRNSDAGLPQPIERVDDATRIVGEERFGDFDDEGSRWEAGLVQRPLNVVHKAGMCQLNA